MELLQKDFASNERTSFSDFLSSYRSFRDTMVVDAWRHEEYPHLDDEGYVCFDYCGTGLFSSSQRRSDDNGGFGIYLAPTSANLATNALYMEGDSVEGFLRKRVLQYLGLSNDDYYVVFTANALSAFKLLACSYPFHEAQNFLYAYDHYSENVEAVADFAHVKGTQVQSVNLTGPTLHLDMDDLQKKLHNRRRPNSQKSSRRGLFAYPYSSCITGSKNPLSWIPEARRNGWHVLLDVTSTAESLRLEALAPDFLIGSFYYVFGEDPTGFGCLVISKAVLRTLGDSSRARAIGMVKILSTQDSSSAPKKEILDSYTCDKSPDIVSPRKAPRHRRTLSMHDYPSQDLAAHGRRGLTKGVHGDGFNAFPSYLAASLLPQGTSSIVQINTPIDPSKLLNAKSDHSTNDDIANSLTTRVPDKDDASSNCRYLCPNPYIHNTRTDSINFTCKSLDLADTLGNHGVTIRIQALSNWLVSSLSRLTHSQDDSLPLVRIYSPMASAERGSSIAFTLLDSVGKVMDPKRVQMLADRNGISLGTGIIAGTVSSMTLRELGEQPSLEVPNQRWFKGEATHNISVPVLYASLSFLNNFGDVYRLLLFILRFLDPDFVRQEVWHYQALNQETIEI